MWIRIGIVLALFFLFGSCAQVEQLSGGLRDEFSPRPDLENMVPSNGSTNFQGKEMVIPFDEFFTLNNPTENIVVIPPDIKPKAKIKNKTLVLSWEEDLKPNTTYAFYLNGLVQDVTEKNDSLMSFVFSTGSNIDSLEATFFVVDAFSKEMLAGQTVALYSRFSDTLLPDYFGKTDRGGKVNLQYLKPGDYQLVVFGDKSKDLKPQKSESFGFKIDKTILTASIVDSVPLLLSPPVSSPKITSLKLNPPNTFFLAANRNLEGAHYLLNGQPISDENILAFSRDSVLVAFQMEDSSTYEVVVGGGNWTDTARFRLLQKDKAQALKLQLLDNKDLLPDAPIRFYSNHLISSLDVPLVSIMNTRDSSNIPVRSITFRENYVELHFDRKETISTIQVTFLPNSAVSSQGKNTDTLRFKLVCLDKKDVGSLKVNLEDFENAIVLELMKNGKLIESIPLNTSTKEHLFQNLLAGEYSFRVIDDGNENGKWDGGIFITKTPPESIYIYPKPQKVRGNWDTQVSLKANINGE